MIFIVNMYLSALSFIIVAQRTKLTGDMNLTLAVVRCSALFCFIVNLCLFADHSLVLLPIRRLAEQYYINLSGGSPRYMIDT